MTGGGRHDDRSAGEGGQAGDDLVDLLYGELPPDEERAVRARVAGDPALMGKLSEMERVRELMRGVADAEPPPHISAQLLAHAAQVTARGSRAQDAQPGFWTRVRSWMQPLIAHPGLAAATSLLVVAGVASVLLMRQGDDLTRAKRSAEPPPAEPTESEAEESAPALEPGAPAEQAEAGEGYAGGEGAGVATGGDQGGAAPGPADAPAPAVSGDARRRSSSRRERQRRSTDKNASRDDAVDVGLEDGRVLGLTEQDRDQARGAKASEKPRPSDESGDAESEAPAGQASPPPAPTSPPASSPSSSEPAPEPKQAAAPSELHERAVKAAANRRCLEVQSLGQAIRRADPAYHEKVFRGDKRLAVCLSSGRPAKGR